MSFEAFDPRTHGRIDSIPFAYEGNLNAAQFFTAGTKSVAQPSNVIPGIMPVDVNPIIFTFANATDGVDITFEFYVQGVLIYTWPQLVNVRWAVEFFQVLFPFNLSAGDRLSVRGIPGAGPTPQHCTLWTYYQVVELSAIVPFTISSPTL